MAVMKDVMNSFFLGGMVGVTLAILNFLASAFTSSKAVSSFKSLSVTLTLVGFIVRLALLSLVFYGLSKVKTIHFQTALLTFALGFTVCLILKAIHSYRKIGTLKPEPTES
jgi:hypothetical protein